MGPNNPLRCVSERFRKASPAELRFYFRHYPIARLRAAASARRINRHRLEAERRRLDVEAPDRAWLKYLDPIPHLTLAWLHVFELGLHKGPPRRVLDIGTGAGYFPLVLEELRHTAIASDLDCFPVFNAIIDVLRIRRIPWEVKPFQPAPSFGAPVDVVTAFAMDFDLSGCAGEDRWGRPQWEFFLRDLACNVMQPHGTACFGIKRFKGGTGINAYDEDLFAFFQETGADLPRKCRVIYRGVEQLREPARAGATLP